MTFETNIVRKLAPFVATVVLLVGAGAGAAAQTGFKAPTGPQPGDCKRTIEAAYGASPVHAQAMWTSTVAAKFGANWANWPAAQAAYVNPTGQQPLPFLAMGKPCFTFPAG